MIRLPHVTTSVFPRYCIFADMVEYDMLTILGYFAIYALRHAIIRCFDTPHYRHIRLLRLLTPTPIVAYRHGARLDVADVAAMPGCRGQLITPSYRTARFEMLMLLERR